MENVRSSQLFAIQKLERAESLEMETGYIYNHL